MSLLSPSETSTINTFLTSVERNTNVEFQEVTPDLAQKITIKQGKDALAKATMDLLAKGGTVLGTHNGKTGPHSKSASPSLGGGSRSPSHWPSFGPDTPASASSTDKHPSGSRESTNKSSAADSSSAPSRRQQSQRVQHSQSDPQLPTVRASMSTSSLYTLPPLVEHLTGLDSGVSRRDPLFHSVSAPANTTKRSFPPENDGRQGSSSSTTKRSRRSPPNNDKSRRQSAAASASKTQQPKPALLSASQKRANHIQSEQKRRANIRRGYEALCSAVPELRAAIEQEESNGGGDADAGGNSKSRKRRKKSEESALDGRAGPKSENVVLSKTIDYIKSLLGGRQDLLTRLQVARGALPLGHPSVAVLDSAHLDEHGVPLWEREWNGGTGMLDDEDDDGGEDDGGEDGGGSDDDDG